jgi:hypothetical protein
MIKMDEGQIHRGQGLVDLIAGKTPSLVDWTVDPTDGADITDGDITTFCTTGSKTTGAGWQYAYLDWDLGAMYNVLCTGALFPAVTAGSGYCYLWFWDDASWVMANDVFVSASSIRHGTAVGGLCSKVRLGITSNAAADVTPNIRELHAWRL